MEKKMNKIVKAILITFGVIISLSMYAAVGAIFNSESNTASRSDQPVKYKGNSEMKAEFMAGCNNLEGVDASDYCECSYNYLVRNNSDSEFNELVIDYANEPVSAESEAKVTAAAESCFTEL
jgi:flagellar basal body-associated protein FliL